MAKIRTKPGSPRAEIERVLAAPRPVRARPPQVEIPEFVYPPLLVKIVGRDAKSVARERQRRLQIAFLASYSVTGSVMIAASHAGIDPATHRNWLKTSPVYVEGFDLARDYAADLMEREARRRALAGSERPVFQGGRLVGTELVYSDRLLELLLKGSMPEKYKERHELGGPGGGPIPTSVAVTFGGRFKPMAELPEGGEDNGEE